MKKNWAIRKSSKKSVKLQMLGNKNHPKERNPINQTRLTRLSRVRNRHKISLTNGCWNTKTWLKSRRVYHFMNSEKVWRPEILTPSSGYYESWQRQRNTCPTKKCLIRRKAHYLIDMPSSNLVCSYYQSFGNSNISFLLVKHTRVRLLQRNEDIYDSYINANYINTSTSRNDQLFIAT